MYTESDLESITIDSVVNCPVVELYNFTTRFEPLFADVVLICTSPAVKAPPPDFALGIAK